MRTLLLACACTLAYASTASADEDKRDQHLESQTDIGGVFGSHETLRHRWLTRTFLNVDDDANIFEAHYGLAWVPIEHFKLDATAGWAYASGGHGEGHALILGAWAEATFQEDKIRLRAEGLHRLEGPYRYEGFYAFDYSVVGAHLSHHGDRAYAGFQTGSGHGLLPFRFDVFVAFGLTGEAADHVTRFVLTFDFR